MTNHISINRFFFILLFFSTVFLNTIPVQAADPNDSIKYRKIIMELIGNHMGSIAMITKGKISETGMADHAQGLSVAAGLAIAAFRPNTHDQGSKKTTSKEEIWTDWTEFEAGLKKMATTAEQLMQAAKAGQSNRYGDYLVQLGRGCKGCHDDFRDEHRH